MGTIAEKLSYLLQTKSQIAAAITEKGVAVPADTPFRGYPALIASIKTGGDNRISACATDFSAVIGVITSSATGELS